MSDRNLDAFNSKIKTFRLAFKFLKERWNEAYTVYI